MTDIALYYPWTRVRDETWLKAAALYWPRLAVLSPVGYTRNESPTARVLREELGFLVEADPAPRALRLAEDFLTLISQQAAALVARYGWLAEFPRELNAVLNDCRRVEHPVDDDRVNWIHRGKLPDALLQRLVETRLGVASPDRTWVAVHPRLASVYLTALADRVAAANNLAPVTDQPRHYGVLNGWTLETITRVLLTDDVEPPTSTTAEVSALYASLAVATMVPVRLEAVPVERIVRARRALADEFDAFRQHVEALGDQLADIARTSEDPKILREKLDVLVDRDFRGSTADLERGLRRLGLEPVRAVLGLTSLALPITAAWLPEMVGVPVVVGSAGMVAATVVSSTVRAREQAREHRRSAAGYLLGLREELGPSEVVNRVRRTLRTPDPASPLR
ncbi:hypothetical protein I6A60_33765 [Frankia sp. AgB1.9]|uniref:DUF6236 family protein n=1 Tax=unclassified Frankia TaxID=2632575 RepID=UPI0019348616|nr:MULTISPECIES: DUF6236 family protein [unclassified Frankia]MBL7493727.1 hypothetical protein [Frankia sp. AgW1.1]MBL7552789.1 hypothetical protein [Frankia sp. AgB1.9]MBL7625405.1 hypothetical protein [Frankia sp. AgB1.8]